jgi:hypothetical protein
MEHGVTSPEVEYARRLEARRREAERQGRLRYMFGRFRAATVVVIVFLIILTEKELTAAPKMLALIPAALTVVLIVRWNRAARARQRAVRAARYYEGRIGGLRGEWPGEGESGARYLVEDHPAALDLDLFGPGSLFESLCTARTRPGQDTLAGWLSAPADGDEVRARQAAASELRPRLDLHEDLVVLGSEIPDDGRLAYLSRPVREEATLPSGLRRLAWAAPVLSAAALIGAACGLPTAVVLLALVPQVVVAVSLRRYANQTLELFLSARAALGPLSIVLARLEREDFSSSRLLQLQAALRSRKRQASRLVWQFDRLLGLELPALLFACRPQFALAVEAWWRANGRALGTRIGALAEMEALGALATRARENPHDVFPEVVGEGPCFEAAGLGHPFLPRDRCVINDITLGRERSLFVVSGSNMSGKSTFLRSVGINAVLALAGAPVRATRLRLSVLVPGATLRVQDSLRDGRSRFYAEALRVRRLLEMADGPVPLLFLLDEIFQGTNSRDRRVGAEAVLRRLLDRGAIGLVTTHDLTLTEITDLLAPRAVNVHFADQTTGGGLAFDYRLREGVVASGNGLALLRAVGIEV